METLRTKLESGVALPKEHPFIPRPFTPVIGDKWIGNAVAYGCYRKGQAPGVKGPTDEELLEDLNIIAKHWNLIRLYGADLDTSRVLRLIEAHGLPIKAVLGIWLEPEVNNPEQRLANVNHVLLAIELTRRYADIVMSVSVGNETQVFWSAQKMKPENLIRYVRAVRSETSVPVTTADDHLYWLTPDSKHLAAELDFVFTHIHPLWNGQSLDNAIRWHDATYREIRDVHTDRAVVIGETGWATDYDPSVIGPGEQGSLIAGEVGFEAQTTFLMRINEWIDSARVPTFLFEAFDESWKGGGDQSSPRHVEKHWGVYYEDRTPKESFLDFLNRRRHA